jgi:hypothetical protein
MVCLEWIAHPTSIRWRWSGGAGAGVVGLVAFAFLGCGVWWRVALVSSSSFAQPTIGLVPLSPSQPEFYSLSFCILFSFCLFGSGISPCFLVLQVAALVGARGAASSVQWYVGGVESNRWVRKRRHLHRAPPTLPASAAAGGRATPLLAQVRIVPLPITLLVVRPTPIRAFGCVWVLLVLSLSLPPSLPPSLSDSGFVDCRFLSDGSMNQPKCFSFSFLCTSQSNLFFTSGLLEPDVPPL